MSSPPNKLVDDLNRVVGKDAKPPQRQPVDYRFIKALGQALRYEAGLDDVEALLNSMSRSDWNNTDGTSIHRGVLADALEENGRHAEADLLRGPQSIYVSHGTVRPRVASPKAERAFVDSYLHKILEHSLAPSGHPLHWEYGVRDLHPDTLHELTRRAVAFLNDSHPHLRNFDIVKPLDVASAYANAHNLTGYDFDEPFMDAYKPAHKEELSERAEKDGRYYLKPDARNKLVRDTSMN